MADPAAGEIVVNLEIAPSTPEQLADSSQTGTSTTLQHCSPARTVWLTAGCAVQGPSPPQMPPLLWLRPSQAAAPASSPSPTSWTSHEAPCAAMPSVKLESCWQRLTCRRQQPCLLQKVGTWLLVAHCNGL
jgi:hypothetical protein